MSKQKTKTPVDAQEIAGVSQTKFVIRDGKTKAAIQISVAEVCTSASAVPAACVTAACDSFTEAAHGFSTGLIGQFTTTCVDLPSGLCTSTNYFIINIDACTYKVGTTRANAIAGTVQALADAGTGTHTFTPTATSCTPATNGTITFHASVDCSNFATADLNCTSLGLTKSGTNTVEIFTDVPYNSIQTDIDVLLGQWTISVDANAKE